MRSKVQKQAIVDSILITVVAAIVVSMAPSISAARTAKTFHLRSRNGVTTPPFRTAVAPSTAEVLQRQNEILAGLEVSQSALEKAATDSNASIQRAMNQLRADLADSHRVLTVMNQRIDSMRRWLRSVVLFFFLSLCGLFYVVFRPVRIRDNSFKPRGRAAEKSPAEDEIVQRQNGEPANAPGRAFGLGKNRELPSAR
jgi:hypothetical protein